MATKKPAATVAAQTKARALVDIPSLGIKSGQLIDAAPEVVAALVADGSADAHPDAIKHAEST